MATIKSQVNRPASIEQVFGSDEMSLAKIKGEYNETIQKTVLLDAIVEMVELVGAELNETQLKFLLDFILTDYWFLKLSDFHLISKSMIMEKVYHKPSIQSFVVSIREYDKERSEFAASYNKKKQEKRDSQEEIDAWNENYPKLFAACKAEPEKKESVSSLDEEELRKTIRPSLTTPEELNAMNEDFIKNVGLK